MEIADNEPATQRMSIPTPFLIKMYQLVDDPTIDGVISWNEDGTSCVVWRPVDFARDICPKYFKHNKFSSFVRQFNTYGFRKVAPERWEFANDYFRRGEKHLLCKIHRRKITNLSTTTTSVDAENQMRLMSSLSPRGVPLSSSTAELMDKNERLKRENLHLSLELVRMKDLCNNIYMMMSNVYNNQNNNNSNGDHHQYSLPNGGFPDESPPPPPVGSSGENHHQVNEGQINVNSTLKETEEQQERCNGESSTTMLFGVPIGPKR